MNYLKLPLVQLLNKTQTSKKYIRKGLSLIEAAMVLALSAIVVAGVIAYYQSASDNQKTEATISMLTSLMSVINSTYASQPNYQGLSVKLIAHTGALPASMVNGDELTTPGGGMLYVSAGDAGKGTGDPSYYTIDFPVTRTMCQIMTRLDLGSSLSSIYVGDMKHVSTKPLNVPDSQKFCEEVSPAKESGQDDMVTLFYIFH